MEFKVGDKVKLLHDNATGEVLQVYPNDKVLILVDDLIELELSTNEVVSSKIPVSQTKQEQEKVIKKLKTKDTLLENIIYFSISIENDIKASYHLVNHTPYDLIYAVWNETQVNSDKPPKGLVSGNLPAASAQLLFTVKLENWEFHRHLRFNFIYFSDKDLPYLNPESRELRIYQKNFYGDLVFNPYLNLNTLLIPFSNLDTKYKSNFKEYFDYDTWKSPPERLKEDIIQCDNPDTIIDLHITSIVQNINGFSKNQIFETQLDVFERCLSLALAHNLAEITFIHGIGEGRLKDELHRRLKEKKFVVRFEISPASKFGQGATTVYL